MDSISLNCHSRAGKCWKPFSNFVSKFFFFFFFLSILIRFPRINLSFVVGLLKFRVGDGKEGEQSYSAGQMKKIVNGEGGGELMQSVPAFPFKPQFTLSRNALKLFFFEFSLGVIANRFWRSFAVSVRF